MLVLKFGGTSVEDAAAMLRCIEIIHGAAHRQLLVALSACAGVTDGLVAVAKRARDGDIWRVTESLQSLRKRHLGIASGLMPGEAGQAAVQELEHSFESLRIFLHAIAVLRDLTPRAQDYVVSHGELWSSTILCHALLARNMTAARCDARELLVTDRRFTAALPLLEPTRERLKQKVRPLLECGAVVVTQGFVGATEEGVISTIGRGGSDISITFVIPEGQIESAVCHLHERFFGVSAPEE